MRASALKMAPLLIAIALAATACKDDALGSETAGTRVKTAYERNVSVVDPARRTQRPVFSGVDLHGEPIGSQALRGHVSVVNFWASWCGECRHEQTILERVWQRYRDRGVTFLGINIRDRKADALAYYDEFKVTYPSVYNFDSSVAATFRLANLPQTFVLDPEGRVAVKIVGATTAESQLSTLLDAELERQTASP